MGKVIGFIKSGKWTVIDTNETLIGKVGKNWYPYEETLNVTDSILLVQPTFKGKRRGHQKVLYHYGTNDYSSDQIGWLLRAEMDGKTFCWAKSGKQIIIYNSHLKEVKRLDQKYARVMEDLEMRKSRSIFT